MDADLRRIAFVTKRYPELQGLRSAALGAALIGCALAYDLSGPFGDPMLRVFLYATLLNNAAFRPLDRYYERVFGIVSDSERRWGWPGIWTARGAFPAAVSMALLLDMLNLGFAGVRIPSLGGVCVLAFSVWILVRDWPHRFHYVIATAAASAACVVTALAPASAGDRALIDPIVGGYYVVAAGIIGLALIAVGLLDHRLLVQSMWRPAERTSPRSPAPVYLSSVRLSLSGSVAAVVAIYIAFMGWPVEPISFSFVLVLALLPAMLTMGWDDMTWGFRAYRQLTRAREARLLARIQGSVSAEVDGDDAHKACIPKPDVVGHLVLPLAVACAGLIDVALRPGVAPLFLPIALALSQARIAFRDWPTRKHYILGVVAAATMAAVSLIETDLEAIDWLAGFVLLFGIANFTESLLDRRLERGPQERLDRSYGYTV